MMFRQLLCAAAMAAGVAASSPALAPPAAAEAQRVIVIVNDQAITERDISQRVSILRILGDPAAEQAGRKKILQALIDEQVKLSEAKKYNLTPTEAEVTSHVQRMAKNMKTDEAGLLAKLKKQGISEATFRRYISAQTGFNRIIASKYKEDVKVSDADVDRKFNEIKTTANSKIAAIMNDPRMQPLTVYTIMEISLPVEGKDDMLLQARAVEAAQYAKRFKGCGSARQAAEGIFNVKIGKKVDADAKKLPKPMKAALDKAGVGKAVGPMRGPGGIQLLALCGVRKLTPPKPNFQMPTRDQVENLLINEKYDGYEEEYLKTARNSLYVEYRDPSYSQ